MKDFYKGKKILITGAAGTVGREIVKQVFSFGPAEMRLMDNNETEMFFLMETYGNKDVFCFLGDVRDRDKLEKLSKDIDIIIHSAAFKHVYLSEYNPFDVVQTNIIGVENIIRAANAVRKDSNTILSSTRFGNVLGSRGSVVPLFMKQIKNGGPVTITDKKMTRFVMTIEEAARLVLQSVLISRGGEVFVTKMPVVRITDLAEVMIKLLAPKFGYNQLDIKTIDIGSKPGEKLFEELMTDQEVHRSIELKDMFVVTPAFKSLFQSIKYEYPNTLSNKIEKSYISETESPLSKEEIEKYLIENRVLEQVEESSFGTA
jgi:FlaA1/EpsC-like NDP-sugar epimerase